MTPERWREVKQVLACALERTPEDRRVYLDQACADASVRREVESLLAAEDRANPNFLQYAAVPVAPLEKGSKLGEYTILAQIGAGGMGEVYRAWDTRLNRNVAIKVLPSFFSDDRNRLRRFEQEARAAAALNHPNILAVFQMGTHEGSSYMVSELLEGGTLRQQLKHGPLPLRKAVDFGVQIARGLAAAHEKGVVHRDLKPENLFITKDGRVKILDFGLAKLTQRPWTADGEAATVSELSEPGAVLGTVGYMSPEQVSAKATDHRADIFAFGVVLYEMLTGKRAFQKPTPAETMAAILNEDPPAVSQQAPSAPVALQGVVQRCLEKNPEQRFQSASDLAFALEALSSSGSTAPSSTAHRHSRGVWLWVASGATAALMALAVGGYVYFHRAPKLTAKDSIVVSDFANSTGDPVFDGTLRQGLTAQLQQTPFLQLVSGDRITQALRLMEKPTNTPLTQDVAREICQRVNATALIQGSIDALGNQYVLGLDALNCSTGEIVVEEQVTADGKERVLAALGTAASELRKKLGESAASLQTYDVPFDQAITTSSLQALQAYTRGSDALLQGDIPSSIPFLRRAVAIDPNFATAYSNLGMAYSFGGDRVAAVENVSRAYSLKDRTTEREQFTISTNYAQLVTGDVDEAARLGEQWAKVFPRDLAAYLGLTNEQYFAGQLEQSLVTAREFLRLDPTPFAYWFLAWKYLMLGHVDEARTTIQQAEADHVDPTVFGDVLYALAFLDNNSAAMDRASSGPWPFLPPEAPDAARSEMAAYHGQLPHSRELMERAIATANLQRNANVAATYTTSAALTEALLGNFPEARKALSHVDAGNSSLDPFVKGNVAVAMALLGEFRSLKSWPAISTSSIHNTPIFASARCPPFRLLRRYTRASPMTPLRR